jgi:hypothetical protein
MKQIIRYVIVIAVCASFFGCTQKMGTFSEQTHFSYPNSNVKPLGQVKSSIKKTRILFPYLYKAEDIKGLINEALAQKPGADLLINYKTDTKITSLPFPPYLIWQTVTLEGTAASIEVGEQELQEAIEKSGY